ncbi:4-hydroxythreonine-4-phosphate dehydrogenase PdxA [Prosthecochloris sp. HL-130-GSB]|uniref:4-hydroxythreonine-4-phosphate dehydrogenase PdxA n=1 Tax=Prosthecochloris sp. HL-130-GSB TaxID=1974213 RepID=UPI000A1C0080|nr:4-hydroxythreonine-4-phosphate dehydrogenase PdxA [Prosthecochloris sp. HL-130-GSB]ARM31243.1 4-hydroxythreonine-4-phosphate dehydrogenase PdxA [Prosthecochloris sp. HL-130-GSB]MBO8092476.1 4-hydroxythreonine-4-phosphate dehydrogenase PdxA [Prosthecochloris sp.]
MLIAWSIGDIHGTGPEIILRSYPDCRSVSCLPVVTGSAEALRYYRDLYRIDIEIAKVKEPEEASGLPPDTIPVISTGEPDGPVLPGRIDARAGDISMKAVRHATELCIEGRCEALVTAPIHKEAVALAGYPHTGHTGFLGELCQVASPTMLFFDPVSGLTVALATIHIALRDVPDTIAGMDMERFFRELRTSLQKDFRVPDPAIAVLGLNPHASDGGVMGNEEQTVLEPVIRELAQKYRIEGPFPADGFFGSGQYRNYDITVAMYHDQGLLPFKVLAFETGINVTLGLPIVRTSPDHGTGFDIAGKGIASPRSFTEACLLARTISINRKAAD